MNFGPDKLPVLSVANLNVSYSGRAIVDGLNFHVVDQAVLGIVGQSGSGKTTLLRALNRLLEEDPRFRCHGDIFFGERHFKDPSQDRVLWRRSIGMVFQKPVIFPVSIYKNVLFGVQHLKLIPRKKYPEMAEKYLREAYLWEEVKERLHESALTLSVGQQQRLAIARSLAMEPSVLLMDEPTSALDANAIRKIEELILDLRQKKAIVLVTHNLEQARRVTDAILCLDHSTRGGRAVYWGPTSQFWEYLKASSVPPGVRAMFPSQFDGRA